MTVIPAIFGGVNPGERFTFTPAFSPTRRVIVVPDPSDVRRGGIILYADVVVCDFTSTGVGICGRIRSVPVNDVGAVFDGVPESTPFGGWFLSLYAPLYPGIGIVGCTIYLDVL